MPGLFGGSSSKTDRNAQLGGWGQLSSIGQFAGPTGAALINQGAGAQNDAISFFHALMSGDMSKIGKVLSPEISAIQGQESQNLNTLSQFHNRSGGTNAEAVAARSNTQSQIDSLINSLIASSAAEVGSLGTARAGLGTGVESLAESAFGTVSGQAGNARQSDQAQQSQLGGGIASILGPLVSPALEQGGADLAVLLGL